MSGGYYTRFELARDYSPQLHRLLCLPIPPIAPYNNLSVFLQTRFSMLLVWYSLWGRPKYALIYTLYLYGWLSSQSTVSTGDCTLSTVVILGYYFRLSTIPLIGIWTQDLHFRDALTELSYQRNFCLKEECLCGVVNPKRRGWDSNPRSYSALRFSRPPLLTTQPPLHIWLI